MQAQHGRPLCFSRSTFPSPPCLARPQAWHNTFMRPRSLVLVDLTDQANPSDPPDPKLPDAQPPSKPASASSKPSTLQLQIDARRRFGALAADKSSQPANIRATDTTRPASASQAAAGRSSSVQSSVPEPPIAEASSPIISSVDQLADQSTPDSNSNTNSSSSMNSITTTQTDPDSPSLDASSADTFQQEMEEAELELKENWQRLLQGGRPAPATWRAATPEAAADALKEADAASVKPDASKKNSSSQPDTEIEDEASMLPTAFRDTWATQALLLVSCAVFAMQWAPLVGPALQQLQNGHLDVLASIVLACPDTPVCTSLQLASSQVLEGHWASLLTSSLLHGGALPLLFAFISVQDVGVVLQMAEGPLLFACIYLIAGASASMAQLLISQQAAGIAGTGAVVGLYSALVVHSWKTGQGRILMWKDAVALTAAALFSAFQPNLGLWSFVGGAVGGAVASLLSMQILVVLRFAVYLPLVGIMFLIDVASKLPRFLFSAVMNSFVFLASGAVEVVKTIRGL